MLPVTLHQFQSNEKHQSLPKLTKNTLEILETTRVFTIGEKVELLLLFLHKKWIAEVDVGLRHEEESAEVLRQLGLPWYIESYDPPQTERWLQVGANMAVLDYVRHRRGQLSDLESGILYGFPLTHVLGYVGILKRELKRPAGAAQYMLAGVYSKDFQAMEVSYFKEIWAEVERVSPTIAKESQLIFESYYKTE